MADNSKVIFTRDELDTVHSLLHKRNPDPLDKVVSFSAADDRWIRWEHRAAIHACLEPKILSIDFEKTRETIRIIGEVWAEVLKLREAKSQRKRGSWELDAHNRDTPPRVPDGWPRSAAVFVWRDWLDCLSGRSHWSMVYGHEFDDLCKIPGLVLTPTYGPYVIDCEGYRTSWKTPESRLRAWAAVGAPVIVQSDEKEGAK